ncbi:hypothetical protein Hanom_Chr05g00469931 [Helianthus anomalus]
MVEMMRSESGGRMRVRVIWVKKMLIQVKVVLKKWVMRFVAFNGISMVE